MKNIKKLLNIAPKAKKYFYFGLIFCIITSLLSIITPLLIAKSIDNTLYNISLPETKIIQQTTIQPSCSNTYFCHKFIVHNSSLLSEYPKPVFIYLLISLIVFILIAIFDYLQNISLYRLSKEITFNLRNKIYHKIYQIPQIQYNNSTNGEIISLITNDIEAINTSLASDLSEGISSIILFIGILIAMLNLNITLSIIIIITIPLSLILLAVIIKHSEHYFTENQNQLATYNSLIEETYSGHDIINYYNCKEEFIIKHQDINRKLQNSNQKSTFLASTVYSLTQFITNLTFVVTCIISSLFVIKGKLSLGSVQAFITYAKSINEPLLNLTSLTTTIETINASAKRIFTFLELPEEKKVKRTNYKLKGQIKFNNVSFAYNEKNVLNNINFTINPGEKIAIVGATGSGKTTIIKLLLKFFKPNSGSITIDGIDLQKIHYQNLRDNINIIPQDHWLFSGTIKENVIYNQKTSNNLLTKSLKKLHLTHFIKTFPNQENYIINENGTNLSIGEKQLLTIARANLKKAPIIILDEATSNLDSYTEETISNALFKIIQNKTTIIIAHRLTTIKNVDKIIVINNGQIIESGTHQELINKKGHYYQMYNDH